MRTRIINPKFPDIYKLDLYQGNTLSRVFIKAGTSELSDPDFVETDFKYTQEKLEFDCPEVLSELGSEDKELINEGGLGSVEKYFLTLFPSMFLDSSSSGQNISYFSTNTNSEGLETMCVLIPEAISRIMMFDSNSSEAVEVKFEGSEIEFSKVLTMITSYDPTSPLSINLSWKAYEGDKNPVKRMSEYVLRNDSFVENWKGYYVKEGFLYSGISSFLIGTEKVESRPIYNLLKGFSRSWWNRSKRYSIGDIVKVGENEYESLESDNIGNHPYYSRMWIKKRDDN